MMSELVTLSLNYDRRKDKMNDEMFMRLAKNVSEFSSCARVQVGAVLVVDNRPLLSGYNGTPKGHEHCIDIYKAKYVASSFKGDFEDFMALPEIREEHGKFSRLHEVHAEINIVAQAAYKGLATKGGILYVTHSPCNDCCKSILTAGIKQVIFLNLYDRETEGLQTLIKSDVGVRQLILDEQGQVLENKRYLLRGTEK